MFSRSVGKPSNDESDGRKGRLVGPRIAFLESLARHLENQSGRTVFLQSRLLWQFLDLEIPKSHLHGRPQVELKSDPPRFLSIIVNEIERKLSV